MLQCRKTGFNPWIGKIPQKTDRWPTPVFLSEEFHGQRGLVGYCPWDCKESDTTEWPTLHFHSFRGSGVQAQVRLDPLFRISFSSLMAVGQQSQLSSKSLHSDPGSFDSLTNASFLLQSCEEDFSPGCYRVLHNWNLDTRVTIPSYSQVLLTFGGRRKYIQHVHQGVRVLGAILAFCLPQPLLHMMCKNEVEIEAWT